MADTTINGQCLCGAVTVEATVVGNPMTGHGLGACHCEMCRKWTSGAFIELSAAQDSLVVKGPVKTYTSSEWAERAFCETCGSPLWYKLTIEGTENEPYQLSAGLFDNAADLDLMLEVYIDKKPSGYAFAGERKQMTEAEVLKMVGVEPEGEA